MRAALLFADSVQDQSGKAADTGSLTHAAVAAFHVTGSVKAGLEALASAQHKFPLGDAHDAEIFYRHYTADPRNSKAEAEVIETEKKVRLILPPHETDPTGEMVVIHGTLDQIRQRNGRKAVWDLKTGAGEGWEMTHTYALQISAYAMAATQTLGEPIEPGGIIRAAGYRKRGALLPSPDGVFWETPWSLADCPLLLDAVRLTVAQIRGGELRWGPGKHCGFCPAGGLQSCIPTAKESFGLEMVA